MKSFFPSSLRRIYRAAQRGLSLVEMLVAVLIAGIVLTMAIPIYSSFDKYRQDNECQDKMLTIARAEEMYRLRNRAYTTDLTQLDFSVLVYDFNTPTPAPTATATGTSGSTTTTVLKVKCPLDTSTANLSYTVTLFTDTDGSPGFTIKDACGLHKKNIARQLTSDRNGLKSNSSGIQVDEVACP